MQRFSYRFLYHPLKLYKLVLLNIFFFTLVLTFNVFKCWSRSWIKIDRSYPMLGPTNYGLTLDLEQREPSCQSCNPTFLFLLHLLSTASSIIFSSLTHPRFILVLHIALYFSCMPMSQPWPSSSSFLAPFSRQCHPVLELHLHPFFFHVSKPAQFPICRITAYNYNKLLYIYSALF